MTPEMMTKDDWVMIPNETEDGGLTHIVITGGTPVLMQNRHGHIWFKYVESCDVACGKAKEEEVSNVFAVIECNPQSEG